MKPIDRIAASIDYMVDHYQEQPSLGLLAAKAGYEVTHFQKLFKAHVGISPKQLNHYMNARYARELMLQGRATLDTALETGLSGNARLHDLFVKIEGMSPGGVKERGQGIQITFGFRGSPAGQVLIAKTGLGLCYMGFVLNEDKDNSVLKMKAHWPLADFQRDDCAVKEEAEKVFQIWRGADKGTKLRLDLYGTNFQLQVWQALLRIPAGSSVTYQEIAREVCSAKASRAVGNAVGGNPIALLIPCHRVIRASGIIDNYAWGSARKKLLLAMEQGPYLDGG